MEQGSHEWFVARRGFVGASGIADVMAKGTGATRKAYMTKLLVERLTGKTVETYKSDAMEWGTLTEPLARMAYELETGRTVEQVGFKLHPTIEWAGASPDGLMPDRGLEIKCPHTATHLETISTGKIFSGYVYQMQFGMACTGLQLWDFMSYDPRLPPNLQVWIKTVERDNAMIETIETEVKTFLSELDSMVEQFSKRRSIYG